MSYQRSQWFHPNIDPTNLDRSARAADGVAHRNELIVDEDYWPTVEPRLADLGVKTADLANAYGLVRVDLSDAFIDDATQADFIASLPAPSDDRRGFGRNRIVARDVVAFDDDEATSTPKVLPSSVSTAKVVTDKTLPPTPGSAPQLAGSGVRIGLVDTAFTQHAYVEGSCLYRPARLPELFWPDEHGDVTPGEVTGHATFIASLIKEFAPGANLQVETVISADGLGDLVAVHDAICRLVESGVDVINLSLGCVTADDEIPFVLDHALDWARRFNHPVPLFVASAGNFGADKALGGKKFWPAADSRVWGVAGATESGTLWGLAPYSGHGDWVGAAAPADDVLGARPSLTVGQGDWNAWAQWSGTSFATAVITGLIARQLPVVGRAALRPQGPTDALSLKEPSVTIPAPSRLIPLYGSTEVILHP